MNRENNRAPPIDRNSSRPVHPRKILTKPPTIKMQSEAKRLKIKHNDYNNKYILPKYIIIVIELLLIQWILVNSNFSDSKYSLITIFVLVLTFPLCVML